MTFISDTCSPWRRLYAVLSGTRQWMDTRSVITATHFTRVVYREVAAAATAAVVAANFYTPDARAPA